MVYALITSKKAQNVVKTSRDGSETTIPKDDLREKKQ